MPANFDTKDKFNPSKNYQDVIFGSDAKLLEVELNEMQKIQREARASLTREMVHSGVIDYKVPSMSVIGSPNIPNGDLYVSLNTNPNQLYLGKSSILVNGYKLIIEKGGGSSRGDNSSKIELPTPPIFGSREDLVFLEAWFEEFKYQQDGDILDSRIGQETSRRTKLNWRIRTIAGVDFSQHPEGLALSSGWQGNINVVFSQGGNTEPLNSSSGIAEIIRFRKSIMRTVDGFNDVGLYVSGVGDQNSKDLLKTADGYVYAIPLFRVPRRNSGGYREDNLNGARDYYVTGQYDFTGSFKVVSGTSEVTCSSISTADLDKVKVGDVLIGASTSTKYLEIVSVDKVNKKFVVKSVYGTSYDDSRTTIPFRLESSPIRPDGRYSNIIDKDDIIDLRHKVSLTGYNYQQLLEENFDKLLRGELQTKEKPVTAKNRYGLSKAPLGLKQELVSKRVIGNDGVERDLVNLLGTEGSFESGISGWDGKGTHDTTRSKYGKASIRIADTSSTRTEKDFSEFNANKKYVALIDYLVQRYAGGNLRFLIMNTDRSEAVYATADTSKLNEWQTLAVPFTGKSSFKAGIGYYASSSDYDLNADGFRVYEVDQETYDKIVGLDPAFTGEELAKKFPYISSYPNFVENLFDKNTVEKGKYVSGSTGLLNSGTMGTHNASDYIPVLPSTAYTLSGTTATDSSFAWYDSSKNFISGFAGVFGTRTSPSNASFIRLTILESELNSTQLEKTSIANKYVPHGRYYLPDDYAEGKTKTELVKHNAQRQTFSDAQTSEVVTDIIESLKTPQKHVTVTQATAGQWAIGDTVKIKSYDGVVSGVIDSDTALAVIASIDTTTNQFILSNVTGMVDGDSFSIWNDVANASRGSHYVKVIDSTNKIVEFYTDSGLTTKYNPATEHIGEYVYETTASTSSPEVTCAGLAGTWSGLGTKEATYTINTAPTTNTDPIKVKYSVNYPSGQGIEFVPTEVYEAGINGQKLVKASDNIVRVKANYAGKISGNSDRIPHRIKGRNNSTSPLSPSDGLWGSDIGQSGYDSLSTLNGISRSLTATNVDTIAQDLFSFDLIRLMTDKYGEGFFADCLTTADKVAKIEGLISRFNLNWWGYGSSPNGNKATVSIWDNDTASWTHFGSASHTGSAVTKLLHTTSGASNIARIIGSDGFIHFLAYAEASDGTTASTIYTDYVDLEVELNVAETGFDVLIPDNKMPVLSENILDDKFAYVRDSAVFNANGNSSYEVFENGEVKLINDSSATPDTISRVQIINSAKRLAGEFYTVSVEAKKGTSSKIGIEISGAENGTGIKSFDLGDDWEKISYSFKQATDSEYTYIYPKVNHTEGNPGEYMFFKRLKIEKGVNPNPKWSAGRKKKTTHNFLGKVAGSTVENKHVLYFRKSSLFSSPSVGLTEMSIANYANISKQDGALSSVPDSTSGNYSQQLFEFDLSHLGLSLKELKSALRKLTVSWTGYGSGSNAGVLTYGAQTKWWRQDTTSWSNASANTGNSPSTLTDSTNKTDQPSFPDWYITKEQKIYILVHSTHPSDGTIASEIYTDYVKLEVELADYVDYVKGNVVKVRKETKELKLQYPSKSHRLIGNGGTEDKVELFYKHVPYQGTVVGSGKLAYLRKELTAVVYGTGINRINNPLFKPIIANLPIKGEELYNITSSFLDRLGNENLGTYSRSVQFLYSDWGTTRGTLVTDENKIVLFYDDNAIKSNLIKGDKALIVGCALYSVNGELFLRVITKDRSKDVKGRLYSDDSNASVADFKLSGSPLVKGVN